MTPTEVLKHEHQVILVMLAAAEREAHSIGSTGRVDAHRVAQMLDFFPNFADRCHHAKEENLLFVKMQERGVPGRGGPIAVMLHEHVLGRQFWATIREALPRAEQGEAAAVKAVGDSLAGYVQLLQAHIHKEDNVLYPMADSLFSDEDQRQLGEAFDRVEAEEIGAGVHERYHQMAHDLAVG